MSVNSIIRQISASIRWIWNNVRIIWCYIVLQTDWNTVVDSELSDFIIINAIFYSIYFFPDSYWCLEICYHCCAIYANARISVSFYHHTSLHGFGWMIVMRISRLLIDHNKVFSDLTDSFLIHSGNTGHKFCCLKNSYFDLCCKWVVLAT